MKHVLIIDTDRRLRTTYAQALQAAGYTTVEASSAQAAIACLEQKTPVLIVLDLQLHGHSGVEFLHELRSYPEWNDVPVLLHTLVPQADLHGFDSAFRSFGIIGYAYKPTTNLKKFVQIVGESIEVNV